LTRELRTTNERLRATNRELMESEARVRDLHGHLEERVAERTRELQRAYEELEGFAYAVAHDLKAPLRAIDGFGHLLAEAVSERDDPRSRSYVERIRRSAIKMAVLIEDLLAYSRIERRTLVEEPIDLDALITTQVAEHAQEIERRGADVRIGVSALRIRADREALAVVLQNLLQNALKFTASKPEPRIDIQSSVANGVVRIVMTDNGIGFDMQYHDQIFKLFHRLHRDDQYEGTGIGLALVRKALERMNGRVQAHSQEGHGATFSIELPYLPG
jgi:signal transduction histidine kinase